MIQKLLRLLCLMPFVLTVETGHAESVLRFYYFNPDTPLHNLSRLKTDMGELLESLDYTVEFQPFARFNDFNHGLREDRPSFVFAPDWFVKRYSDELHLQVLLQALRDKQRHYRKYLVSGQPVQDKLGKAEFLTLAMTGMGQESEKIINSVLKLETSYDLSKVNIIEVPKDTDGILAAALGQVDAAIVSEASLEYLRSINPRLIDSLQVLGRTEVLSMPVLGYIEGQVDNEQQLAMKQLMQAVHSASVLRMLSIDGWREQ